MNIKCLIPIIVLLVSTNLFGQNMDSVLFDFDHDIKFEHFNDHWIIKETIRGDGRVLIDTIYSCNYREDGKIAEERISRGRPIEDGIRIFNYNTSGLKLEELFYEERKMGNEKANVSVKLRKFIYDEQNRLIRILESSCFKTLNKAAEHRRDSIWRNPPVESFPSFSDFPSEYTDDWICNRNDVEIIFTLNDSGLPEIINYFYEGNNVSRRTLSYKQDKLVRESFCEFGYFNNDNTDSGSALRSDTTTCSSAFTLIYNYTDSAVTVMANYLHGSDEFFQTDSLFDFQKRIKAVINYPLQDLVDSDNKIERKYTTKTLFFYDKLGRTLRKEEYYHEATEANNVDHYFYKK